MTAQDGAPSSGAGIDSRYFAEGITWERDVIRSVKRSRSIAWFIALVSAAVAILSLVCLSLLLPLKSFEPYVIEVDKTTGYLEIKRALKPGDADPAEAVTSMNVVRNSAQEISTATGNTRAGRLRALRRDAIDSQFRALQDRRAAVSQQLKNR